MKKKLSKIKLFLSLDKESIVKLNESQLAHIDGGGGPANTTTVSSCDIFTCNPDNCKADANHANGQNDINK